MTRLSPAKRAFSYWAGDSVRIDAVTRTLNASILTGRPCGVGRGRDVDGEDRTPRLCLSGADLQARGAAVREDLSSRPTVPLPARPSMILSSAVHLRGLGAEVLASAEGSWCQRREGACLRRGATRGWCPSLAQAALRSCDDIKGRTMAGKARCERFRREPPITDAAVPCVFPAGKEPNSQRWQRAPDMSAHIGLPPPPARVGSLRQPFPPVETHEGTGFPVETHKRRRSRRELADMVRKLKPICSICDR